MHGNKRQSASNERPRESVYSIIIVARPSFLVHGSVDRAREIYRARIR